MRVLNNAQKTAEGSGCLLYILVYNGEVYTAGGKMKSPVYRSSSFHRLRLLFCGVILELLVNTSYTRGQELVIEGPSSSVTRREGFQLKCTVTNTTLNGEQVSFTRDTHTVCAVFSVNCTQTQATTGYACGCVSGGTQRYYTNVTSATTADETDRWACSVNGKKSSSITVDVQYPPSITSVPSNKNVTENTSPNIDCSSNITPGYPSTTSYRWTGPGYSKTGAVLDRSVTRTQGGLYTCTATNTAGSDTASVNINVQYAPNISSLPTTKNVRESDRPNIDCSSNTTPGKPSSTSYRWTGPSGYSKTGAVLDRTVTRTQGGQYTCTANNAIGSDTARVNIIVQYPPTITSVHGEKSVEENNSPNIDCSSNITPGNPSTTSYRWTGPGGYSKNGTVLDRSVTRTQGGQYTCTATNTIGSDTTQVNINVQYLDFPVMSISPPQVMENDSVQLLCNVTSNPIVAMTIRNVDNNIILVDKLRTNSRQYAIQRAKCLHNGTYQCVVNNPGLSRTLTFVSSLNVGCTPRKDFRENVVQKLVSDVYESVSMNAYVIANPLPKFTWWRYDGHQLEHISDLTFHFINSTRLHSVLEVNITRSRDYGIYAVKIENNYGSTLLQYELTSQSRPFPPAEVSIHSLDERSLSLTWLSMYNGGADQVFCLKYHEVDSDVVHLIQNGIPDPGRFKLITRNITGLEENTTYSFTLYSKNTHGTSDLVIINATTSLPQEPPSDNKDALIIGLGVGLGICLVILAAVTIAFVICHRLARTKKLQDAETLQRNYTDLHRENKESQEEDYETFSSKNATDISESPDTYVNMDFNKSDDSSPIYENHPKKQADNEESSHETNSPDNVYVNHLSVKKLYQNSAL